VASALACQLNSQELNSTLGQKFVLALHVPKVGMLIENRKYGFRIYCFVVFVNEIT